MNVDGNDSDGGGERQSLLSRVIGGLSSAPTAASSATSTTGSSLYGAVPADGESRSGMIHLSIGAGRTRDDGYWSEGSAGASDGIEERPDEDHDVEVHEIGYLGSFAIAINSLAGPAVLQLPFQYQQSGFVMTTLALVGVAVLSVACSLYICRVVQSIPAKAKIERPIELSTVVEYFWSHRAYLVTQWLFFACTFCLNVAAMIDTAQVVDTFLGVSGGPFLHQTFGWTPFASAATGATGSDQQQHWHTWSHPKCTRKQVKLGHCDPFTFYGGDAASSTPALTGPILTLGYIITAAVFGPLCLMDLKENTNWQIGGSFLLLTLSLYFCVSFLHMDLDESTGSPVFVSSSTTSSLFNHTMAKEVKYYNSALELYRPDNVTDITLRGFTSEGGSHASTIFPPFSSSSTSLLLHNNLHLWGREYRDLLGVILFNFALVLALPAWLHTKKRRVSVKAVVYGSTGISTLLYVAVGTVVAMSIPHANENMLAPMVSGAFGGGIQAASSLFCFFIIGLDIPLFCVLTRYNLSKLLPGRTALVNALVVYIPWGLSWLLYQGDAIGTLLDWGGVLLTSAIAFLLPLYLAYRVLMYTDLRLFGTDEDDEIVPDPATRRKQIRTVFWWLAATAVAVVTAIGGQAAAQADRYEYLHSEEYLNGTATTRSGSH
jgi:amino acid permease